MTAYYNEIDRQAAAWLRELIKDGLIPAGEVDERDIRDVRADDLRHYEQCHFFAGIAGWSRALRLAGWEGPVWTGSCPCQPFSVAGKGCGEDDERHLWPAFRRLISECRPPVIFGEQVAGKDGLLWLAGVRSDLEADGYAVGAADLCAAGVGAPHIRQRLYWVANTNKGRCGEERKRRGLHKQISRTGANKPLSLEERIPARLLADSECPQRGQDGRTDTGTQGWQQETVESRGVCDIGGMADAEEYRNQELRPAYCGEDETASLRTLQSDECGGNDGRTTGLLANSISGDPQRRADRRGESGEEGPPQGEVEQRERGRTDDRRGGTVGGVEDSELYGWGGRGDGDSARNNGPLQVEGHGTSFWSSSIWHPCRDGKARRIPAESEIFPLAHGVPGRVGLLRGAGNAIVPPVAAEFVKSVMEVME